MVERIGRRLTVDFAGWLNNEGVDATPFIRDGLVVLDANILLSLYRIAPIPRSEVLSALTAISDRLWVPHQAALEFSRNRKEAVYDRIRSFANVKRALSAAPKMAMDTIEAALDQFRDLRERSATTRPWGPTEDNFNADELLARIIQAVDPVLAELKAMQEEHDLHPADVSGVDPVLLEIDVLIRGRIGDGYSSTRLEQLVDEAVSFRYPNEIPPGFRDSGKDTPIRRAGDFLLWQQIIERANDLDRDDRRVLLITNDVKDDWWQIDKAKVRRGPRPELVQELRDRTGADLLLRTLDEFALDAKLYLTVPISEGTLDAVREAREELEWPLPSVMRDPLAPFDLMALSPMRLESLVYHLLVRMGFTTQRTGLPGDIGFDFMLTGLENAPNSEKMVVEVKKVRSALGPSAVLRMLGVMHANGADAGLIITTATFTTAAQDLARADGVRLIDGPELLRLLAEHLDAHGHI